MPVSLTFQTGDLLELAAAGSFSVLVHGCNCFHTFGSGIARQIRFRWPAALAADLRTVYGDRSKLGSYSVATTDFGRIHNVYTQFWVSQSHDVFEYDAFDHYLNTVDLGLTTRPVGLPRIGAGCARGNWLETLKRIERSRLVANHDVVIVTLPGR